MTFTSTSETPSTLIAGLALCLASQMHTAPSEPHDAKTSRSAGDH